MKTETVRARIEPDVKREAEDVFGALGISHSQAIDLFYRQVTLHRGLPFEVRLPNETTRQAMREADQDRAELKRYASVDELFDELESG